MGNFIVPTANSYLPANYELYQLFIFHFFSKRSQNLIFWILIAPLGSLGGPGAPGTPGNPQNLIFTEILQKSENYIKIIF